MYNELQINVVYLNMPVTQCTIAVLEGAEDYDTVSTAFTVKVMVFSSLDLLLSMT